jgi:RsiW-degrading membrane proteinase PrsW (M82 family)
MDTLSVIATATVLALLPTLLYAALIWWLDRHEKEPLPLLIVAFLWGAVPAIVLAIVLTNVAGIPLEGLITSPGARRAAELAVIAPIIEEAVKAVILVLLFLVSRREFDNVLDGIVYGALVGLGFAFVENILYLSATGMQVGTERMAQLWLLRAGLFGLNHSMFTAFTGGALGYARSVRMGWRRGLVASLGLGAAMVLHGLHNTLVLMTGVLASNGRGSALALSTCLGAILSDWGGVAVIIVLALMSGTREARILRDTLWEEVALGRFTQDEYETLTSGRKRWNARWTALSRSGFESWRQLGRLFDLATELAFRKHRMAEGDARHQELCARDIASFRKQIDAMRDA